jgi:hypothetical protein
MNPFLIAKNHETIWLHQPDPKNKIEIAGKAKSSCRHCYGTGIAGHLTNKLIGLENARLVCCCVVRRVKETEDLLIQK